MARYNVHIAVAQLGDSNLVHIHSYTYIIRNRSQGWTIDKGTVKNFVQRVSWVSTPTPTPTPGVGIGAGKH